MQPACCGDISVSEYRNVIIGLIFLKYISTAFDKKYQQLVVEGDGFEDDRMHILRILDILRASARWDKIAAAAHKPGNRNDLLMMLCVQSKPITRNSECLPKNYADPDLDKRVSEMSMFFTNMDMGETEGNRDILGRTYEYCIAQFAEKEGKGGGEFYTLKNQAS